MLYECTESPAVWTQCPVVCFVAPPRTQTWGCLCPYWQTARLWGVMPKLTVCILVGMDHENFVLFVLSSRAVCAPSQARESFICYFWSQRKAWCYNCPAQLCLGQDMSVNHKSQLGNLHLNTWVERVMGPLHASSFLLPHSLGWRTAPL